MDEVGCGEITEVNKHFGLTDIMTKPTSIRVEVPIIRSLKRLCAKSREV